MLAARQKNAFPKRLARTDNFIWGSAGPMLKQCEAKINAAVIKTWIAH
jgi:hypothetical protein